MKEWNEDFEREITENIDDLIEVVTRLKNVPSCWTFEFGGRVDAVLAVWQDLHDKVYEIQSELREERSREAVQQLFNSGYKFKEILIDGLCFRVQDGKVERAEEERLF